SQKAIYILVIDLSRTDIEKLTESIRYWIHCIRSYSLDASVFVVGTHSDLIVKESRMSTLINRIRRNHPLWRSSTTEEQLRHWLQDQVNETPILKSDGVFIVSNKKLESVAQLRDTIYSRAKE